MTGIRVVPVTDWDALGMQWRALEARVPASFFQSWTWVGCLAAERFADPVVVEAREAGAITGLALFNRRRGAFGETLALQESGVAALDTPFVEHNGVLGGPMAAVLRAALHAWRPRRLLLSGVDDATLGAIRSAAPLVRVIMSRPAPFVELARDFLGGRSANTRQQLRRSDRAYGAIAVQRADSRGEALEFLDQMAALHQARWTARGRPGAFAAPFFRRFHAALIERAMPRGEVDLLRITAGGAVVGILYNLRFRGQALAYQSGFDYPAAEGARRPGLTCHHAAIRWAAAAGLQRYDFLAGDDRYKRSLSDGAVQLHWLEAGGLHPGLVARCALAAARRRLFPRTAVSAEFTDAHTERGNLGVTG